MPSSYADALFRTGENLRRGLSDIGRDRRADAELELMRAKGQYEVGRQQAQDRRQEAMDALQRPALEMSAMRARTQQEAYNQPLNVRSMFGPLSLHATETGAGEEIARYLGATLDAQGNLLDSSGRPITQGWLQDSGRMQGVSDIVMSRFDLDTSMQDMIDHYQGAIQSGQISGQEADAAKREIGFMQNALKNPDQRVQLLAIKRSALARLGDTAGVARVDALIADNLKASRDFAKEQRGYAQEEKVQRMQDEAAMERTKYTADARDKPPAEFYGGTWISPSGEMISPDDAFRRYQGSVPVVKDWDTGTQAPTMGFEDWMRKQGYKRQGAADGSAPAPQRQGVNRNPAGAWMDQQMSGMPAGATEVTDPRTGQKVWAVRKEDGKWYPITQGR